MNVILIVVAAAAGGLGFIGWRWWDERRDNAARVAYKTVHGVTVLHPPKGSTAPSREVVEAAIDAGLVAWGDRPYRHVSLNGVRLGWSAGLTVQYAGKPSNMAGVSTPGASEVALADGPRVAPLISHEVGGHQALFASGVPDATGEEHHAIMSAAGFGF